MGLDWRSGGAKWQTSYGEEGVNKTDRIWEMGRAEAGGNDRCATNAGMNFFYRVTMVVGDYILPNCSAISEQFSPTQVDSGKTEAGQQDLVHDHCPYLRSNNCVV